MMIDRTRLSLAQRKAILAQESESRKDAIASARYAAAFRYVYARFKSNHRLVGEGNEVIVPMVLDYLIYCIDWYCGGRPC